MTSKYWKDMFIFHRKSPNNTNNKQFNTDTDRNDADDSGANETDRRNATDKNDTDDNRGYIISKEPPVAPNHKYKVMSITPEDYDKISQFISAHNKMSTGNITLLQPEDISRYLSIDNTSLYMEGSKGIMGTILSLELPIRVGNNHASKIIWHGCTTFLNVHDKIRGFGLCMELIRELISIGYKKDIYCDYHMVPMKLGDNSFPIKSYYRPINLKRCVKIGFLYPDYDKRNMHRRLALRYHTKLYPNYKYSKIGADNIKTGLNYYLNVVNNSGDLSFVFYPDIEIWIKWVKAFPTYLIYYCDKIIGLVSTNSLSCYINITKEYGKLIFPLMAVGDIDNVLMVLNHIAATEKYDAVYIYQSGFITDDHLKNINAIPVETNVYFSLYNNNINLNPENILVPLL